MPQSASSTSITAWVAAVLEAPDALELHVGSDRAVPLAGGWTIWETHGNPVLWVQRVDIDRLVPGRRYPLRLVSRGIERATGIGVTLPTELPPIGAKPFICLVGSCFAHFGDAAGAAGAAYRNLPTGARPDVKFLTGDQVYLDAPFPRYLYNVFAEPNLQAELLATYLATWTQSGDGSGFTQLLRDGATYFTSDDHEVWNNAPLPTPVVRATWWPFGDRGAAWSRIARRLYGDFQAPDRTASFEVGTLSFFVLDTRLERTMDRSRFTGAERMTALVRWVDGLAGPGVLVVGQPIFVKPSGLKGFLADFGLADFAQYGDLVRALFRSRHDILVLTGDVHFGRVAGCRLPSGAALVEVIASPFALVDPLVGGKWSEPPQVFPAVPIPGTTYAPTWFERAHAVAKNNFATLEFSADGSRVLASVRSWPIPAPGIAPTSSIVFQQPLQ